MKKKKGLYWAGYLHLKKTKQYNIAQKEKPRSGGFLGCFCATKPARNIEGQATVAEDYVKKRVKKLTHSSKWRMLQKKEEKKSLKEAKCAIGNSGRRSPVFKVARQAIAINNGRALIQKTMYARKKRRKHMGTAQWCGCNIKKSTIKSSCNFLGSFRLPRVPRAELPKTQGTRQLCFTTTHSNGHLRHYFAWGGTYEKWRDTETKKITNSDAKNRQPFYKCVCLNEGSWW